VSKVRVTLTDGSVEDHEATDFHSDHHRVLHVTGPWADGRLGDRLVAVYQADRWIKAKHVGADEPLPEYEPVIA